MFTLIAWSRRQRAIVLGIVLACGAVTSGCDFTRKRGDAPIDFSPFAELPGLRATHHGELQAELARVVDERATPTLLMENRLTNAGRRSIPRPRLDPAENAATELLRLFDPVELKAVRNRLERNFPAGPFTFTADSKIMVRETLKYYAKQRAKFRDAIARPNCDLNWQHVQGVAASTTGVDCLLSGIRLELLSIADLLDGPRPAAALEPLEYSFRAISFLAQEPHLIPRREAALARAETLRVVHAVVQHPATDTTLLRHLFDLLTQELNSWPADRIAWIGERAEGMHSYELVRNGHLLSILDDVEMVRLRESKDYKQTLSRIRENLDNDEAFYLKTMRQVIDECDLPYYERTVRFENMQPVAEKNSGEVKYPYVALRALLKNFDARQQLQAKDRVLCEAWALLLATAAGQPLPKVTVNGLTGAPYRVLRQKERAVVAGVFFAAEDQPIVIPIPNANAE